jgi:GWxTD domain-containing protein
MRNGRNVAFIISLLYLASCATYRLECRLPKDIKSWYEVHACIMMTHLPGWIDAKKSTEVSFFLRLPNSLKREYMKIFWEIRPEGARETFYSQLEMANAVCRDESRSAGWRTDRGRLILIAGLPDYIEPYMFDDTSGNFVLYTPGEEEWGNPYTDDNRPRYYQTWKYWQYLEGGFLNQMVEFTFCYAGINHWRLVLSVDSAQRHFLDYRIARLSPDENGWDRLYGWLSKRLANGQCLPEKDNGG